MKAVTEFASFVLRKAGQSHASLVGEGKTPEEIQASLGEAFKFEGDKLKYFINAIEIFNQNSENITRVLVMSAAEGETAPPRSKKVDELYYLPEFMVINAKNKPGVKPEPKRKGGREGGKKESPWGLSPEEKAAKNAKKSTGTPAKS
jgi:hypothetical protein